MNNVVCDMPAVEYHALPAWAHSKLKLLPAEPELFYARHILKPTPDWARAEYGRNVELGTAFHAMLLEGIEPAVPPPDLRVASNGAMTTTEAKAWKAANPDYLKRDEYNALSYAVSRCRRDPQIAAYLDTDGDVELSMFWTDEPTGFDCRGRLDKLCRFADGPEILDVKFSAGVDRRWVEGHLAKMSYYRQAAFYMDALTKITGQRPNGFTFLFVRNGPPYDAALWRMNVNDLELGARHNRIALDDLARRLESDNWFGDNFGTINYAFLHAWAYEQDALYATDNGEEFPSAEFEEFAQFANEKGTAI